MLLRGCSLNLKIATLKMLMQLRKKSIVICDDHPIFLEGLRGVLEESGLFRVKAVCSRLEDWHSGMEDADILICDINLGHDRAGFSLISNLPKPMSFGRLVFLTAYDEIYLIRKAKELGACAYVRKDTPMETLVSVLDDLDESFRLIAPGLSDNYLDVLDRQNPEVSLSKRELEVMQLVIDGLSSSQIGDRLFTSRTTIETHRRNIYRKTKATNVMELSRIALQHGWLTAK